MDSFVYDNGLRRVKAFSESLFKYWPLIWMLCNRRANNRVNILHGRALELVYDDYETSLLDLLPIFSSFPVHHTNIQTLLLEMHKIKHNLYESCLEDLFSV